MSLIEIEKKLENRKIILAKQTEFNLFEAFRILDTNKCGYIITSDIDKFVGV